MSTIRFVGEETLTLRRGKCSLIMKSQANS